VGGVTHTTQQNNARATSLYVITLPALVVNNNIYSMVHPVCIGLTGRTQGRPLGGLARAARPNIARADRSVRVGCRGDAQRDRAARALADQHAGATRAYRGKIGHCLLFRGFRILCRHGGIYMYRFRKRYVYNYVYIYVNVYLYIYIHIYIYIYIYIAARAYRRQARNCFLFRCLCLFSRDGGIYVYIDGYVYIYIYIERERERDIYIYTYICSDSSLSGEDWPQPSLPGLPSSLSSWRCSDSDIM